MAGRECHIWVAKMICRKSLKLKVSYKIGKYFQPDTCKIPLQRHAYLPALSVLFYSLKCYIYIRFCNTFMHINFLPPPCPALYANSIISHCTCILVSGGPLWGPWGSQGDEANSLHQSWHSQPLFLCMLTDPLVTVQTMRLVWSALGVHM